MSISNTRVPFFFRTIDKYIERLGNAASWLYSILVLNIVIQVILRYAFGEGKVWLEELQWHLYGICIMFGLSYCLVTDSHIRLDIFHRNYSIIKKEIIEFLGLCIFVLPLFSILFFHGIDFFQHAWRLNECSPSPMGLHRWWIIKSIIPISMLLMVLGALSRAYRALVIICQSIFYKKEKDFGTK